MERHLTYLLENLHTICLLWGEIKWMILLVMVIAWACWIASERAGNKLTGIARLMEPESRELFKEEIKN